MLTIHAKGNWSRGQVRVKSIPSTRQIVPEVEKQIDAAWQDARRRLGEKLFDGPMCRMESCSAMPDILDLTLSTTTYRVFVGTNLAAGDPCAQFRAGVFANPVGVSTALLSLDGWLLFGRRSNNVVYYPHRVHPFAGSLEPAEMSDVFAAMQRELHEELKLGPADLESIRCIGVVEDQDIRHKELIFYTTSRLSRVQIEGSLARAEHDACVAIESSRIAIETALAQDDDFTPVGLAALLLFGNDAFGERWFKEMCMSNGIATNA